MKKLYLAHPFATRFRVRDEIQPIIQYMFHDYQIENPFMREGRENQKLFETESNSEKEMAEILNVDNRDQMIVENDIAQLEACDILVAYIDPEALSVGTACEIFHMKWHLKRPVVILFDKDCDMAYHPFINYLSTKIVFLDAYIREHNHIFINH